MPFEDDLGEALRRAGDGFTTDRHALVDAGERRGRRLVARRRAGVIGGSVLSLALIGTAGAYAGGLLGAGGSGGADRVDVAAPPTRAAGQSGQGGAWDRKPVGGSGAVTAEQLVEVFRGLLPGGKLTGTTARGTEDAPYVQGVYDDGAGKAAVAVGLSRVDPHGSNARQLTDCGDKNLRSYDDCEAEQLADGSRLLVEQGYEYPDRRVDTKLWRAVLVTPQGFQVEASEWNAPAEKGAAVSRPKPPLDPDRLKALVTSDKWHPALNDLPAAEPERAPQAPPATGRPDAGTVLLSLIRQYGISVVSKGGEGEYAYAVLTDGKGNSLVQVNAQANMGGLLAGHMSGADVTTLPDGTKVKVEEKPGEKGGAGVVWWSVDTLRPDGFRVVVSGFNTGNQDKPATRKTPLLTMDQLKELALSPMWTAPQQ
ncbi:hypothetical protein ACFCV9_08035 [Streptomyces sp. NPDC056367]|uniref:hypothetical protein n=1 Tax=unclassified Streptomyces TaxID=2593676 RepID=UPI0035D780C7